MVAGTFFGMEEILAKELLKLGAKNVEARTRAVSFVGDKGFMYKANLCLRTALKIVVPIHRFIATDENELYDKIKLISWEKYIDTNDSIFIDSILNTMHFNHSLFVSQKAKDAIADRFREIKGSRPSVDKINPTLKIQIHIFRNEVTISLDSSGDPLFKRGYRQETNLAPINEVLAAGLVMLSGWEPHIPLLDPMCGSGTILIEAAMLAANIPAGYFRKTFGFMFWKDFDETLWDTILESSINKISNKEVKITGLEISANVCKKAKENISFAKLNDEIQIIHKSFFEYIPEKPRGTIILNPPYGERMIKEDDLNELYKNIGNKLKKDFTGFDVWIISSNLQALKFIGLKPSKKLNLFNGSLECKYMKFEMYSGSKKASKQNMLE